MHDVAWSDNNSALQLLEDKLNLICGWIDLLLQRRLVRVSILPVGLHRHVRTPHWQRPRSHRQHLYVHVSLDWREASSEHTVKISSCHQCPALALSALCLKRYIVVINCDCTPDAVLWIHIMTGHILGFLPGLYCTDWLHFIELWWMISWCGPLSIRLGPDRIVRFSPLSLR